MTEQSATATAAVTDTVTGVVTEPAVETRSPDDFIRQLASACACYRLFPGDRRQPAFRAAVERVEHAARELVAEGPYHVRIETGRFVTPEGEMAGTETVDRLGTSCFERRIEHIHVKDVPSVDDLVTFAEFLMTPVGEVVERGGARLMLEQAGLESMTVGEIPPEDEDEEDPELSQLSPEQRQLWNQLQDPAGLAANLLVGGIPRDPATAANDLYLRFRTIAEILPEQLAARRDFFVLIRQVFQHLPTAVDREFHAIVFTRLGTERFAMSLGVNLTDQELVDALFDLADYGGPDPLDLARRIVPIMDRKASVIELIGARRAAERSDVGTMSRDGDATLVMLALAEGTDSARTAVADALADQLVDAASEDATAVREVFPASDADHRTLVLLSLRDYLAAEDRHDSLQQVLEAWADGVRGALIARDDRLVERLMDIVEAALPADGDPYKHAAAEAARTSIPTHRFVRDLMAEWSEDTPAETVAAALSGFGAASLEIVLDVLAEEESTSTRSRLLSVAALLTPDHVDVIAARLGDDRWYVVRNLVTILGRAGMGAEALHVLARLVQHEDPMVRREVIRSLVASAGSDAVPYLQRLAGDDSEQVATAARQGLLGLRADAAASALAQLVRLGENTDHRREALEALAQHPSPAVPELLSGLASRRGDPALPRPLRRRAKRLQRTAQRGGRS